MPFENVTPKEVLDEIRATRKSLNSLPTRLAMVEKKSTNLVKTVFVTTLAFIFCALFFVWNVAHSNSKQNDNFKEFAQCQGEYNQANTKATLIRSDLSSRLNKAQAKRDKAITKLVEGKPGDVKKIFADYAEEVKGIEKARKDNPLPLYPNCYEKYIQRDPTP